MTGPVLDPEPYVLALGHWSLDELEQAAARHIEAGPWSYVSDVAEDGLAARRERQALDAILLRQRVLSGDANADTAVTLFGQRLSLPVLAAPTSAQGMFHPDGELGTLSGCAEAGSTAVISSAATRPTHELAGLGVGWWRQMYPQTDPTATLVMIEESVAGGAAAIVLTLDVPVIGRRHNLPAGWVPPGWSGPGGPYEDLAADINLRMMPDRFSWDDVATVRSRCGVPLLVKGILDPADARAAVEAGVDGIVVSTHGGRQLDAAPAPAVVLPAVRAAVGDRCTVLADGGVRRGSHVLRLLARGADAVLVGRPVVWGLAMGGAGGVRDVLEILRSELVTTMAMVGCSSLGEITPDVEWRTT